MGKAEGYCSICGEYKVMTYEHIPPECARNSTFKLVKGHEQMFQSESPKYGSSMKARRGFGKYCLCQKCNNFTGGKYGKAYCDFVDQCFAEFRRQQTLYAENEFNFKIKPLNVLKQVVSMFLSVNPGLFGRQNELILRKFVLEKDNQTLPDGYRFHLYTTGSKNSRYAPLSTLRLAENRIVNCTEIAHRPFGWQLTIDCEPTHGMADITEFQQLPFDFEAELTLATSMIDVIGPIPGNILNLSN